MVHPSAGTGGRWLHSCHFEGENVAHTSSDADLQFRSSDTARRWPHHLDRQPRRNDPAARTAKRHLLGIRQHRSATAVFRHARQFRGGHLSGLPLAYGLCQPHCRGRRNCRHIHEQHLPPARLPALPGRLHARRQLGPQCLLRPHWHCSDLLRISAPHCRVGCHVPLAPLALPPAAQGVALAASACRRHRLGRALNPASANGRPHGSDNGAVQRTHLPLADCGQRLHHQTLRQSHLSRPYPRTGAQRLDILPQRMGRRTHD